MSDIKVGDTVSYHGFEYEVRKLDENGWNKNTYAHLRREYSPNLQRDPSYDTGPYETLTTRNGFSLGARNIHCVTLDEPGYAHAYARVTECELVNK